MPPTSVLFIGSALTTERTVGIRIAFSVYDLADSVDDCYLSGQPVQRSFALPCGSWELEQVVDVVLVIFVCQSEERPRKLAVVSSSNTL